MELFESYTHTTVGKFQSTDAQSVASRPTRLKSFKDFSTGKVPNGALSRGLSLLARALQDKYGRRCIVLIDEYDTPFNVGHAQGYLKTVKNLLSTMLKGVLKVCNFLCSKYFEFKLG